MQQHDQDEKSKIKIAIFQQPPNRVCRIANKQQTKSPSTSSLESESESEAATAAAPPATTP